ncbi:hypothetical protein OAP63_00740 [Vibrio sp.]|nr:hypothetical protein [Vibrio sp.]
MNYILVIFFIVSIFVFPTSSMADDLVYRIGYKYNEYPQDRLRFIPTVENTPVVPDFSREYQNSFYQELEYRFNRQVVDRFSIEGFFYAQAQLGNINPVGLQTDDMPISESSFKDDYYFGATFPELYAHYSSEIYSLDFGFINPVYGNSSIVVADVFSKTRMFVGMRKSEDSSTELRQGNLGLRLTKFLDDGELTLIYMPDIPDMYELSNFGSRSYLRYERDTSFGSFATFLYYQTRDNYDGPYSAVLDVYCAACTDFDVPSIRETDNTSIGMQFDAGISNSLTMYSEALLSEKTSKFLVTQTGEITGNDFEQDANSVKYTRDDNGPYLKAMLGVQYSFTPTDLARFEYIYDQNGYTSSEKKSWLKLLDLSLSLRSDQLYGDLRDFNHNFGTFSQEYAFWNYEKRIGDKADDVLSLGQYISLDDISSLSFIGYTHSLNNRATLNIRGTFAEGGKYSDFGSIGERSSLSVYTEIRF